MVCFSEGPKAQEKVLKDWYKMFSDHFGLPVKILFYYSGKYCDIRDIYRTTNGMLAFDRVMKISIKSAIDETVLYGFGVGTQPGLCGCMYFTELYRKVASYSKMAIKTQHNTPVILQFIKELAYALRYRNVMCSSIVPHETLDCEYPTVESKGRVSQWNHHKLRQNLLQAGFKVTTDFVNKRSSNRINIYNINL